MGQQGWTLVQRAAPEQSAPGWTLVQRATQPSRSRVDRIGDALEGVARTAEDVVLGGMAGFGKNAITSLSYAGDLARRIPGVAALDRLVPPVPVDVTLRTPSERVGGAVERLAEFALPAARVSRAVAAASLPVRLAAEAGAGAALGGFQGRGDVGAAAAGAVGGMAIPAAGALIRGGVRTAQRAAAGAREGGVGGAVAGAIRTVAPPAPKAMITQAIKPASTRVRWDQSLDLALPELNAAQRTLGRTIASAEDLLEATTVAKRTIQGQLGQLRQAQGAIGAEVDLTPVATAMARAIPRKLQLQNPRATARLRQAADVYRNAFALDDAETLLRETNAELKGFYAMYPAGQQAARTANPRVASLEAQAKALRDAIYDTLDAPGQGAAARTLNQRYGALLELEHETLRRVNVAARQQPESLSEQIGTVRAAADAARGAWRVMHGDVRGAADIAAAAAGRSTAKAIRDSQTTNALIRRAFQVYDVLPAPVAMPPITPIRGYLGRGPVIAPPGADPSFARGVPAEFAVSGRPRQLGPGATRLPAPPDPSLARGVPARSIVQRDPRTGRMRRVYVGDGR